MREALGIMRTADARAGLRASKTPTTLLVASGGGHLRQLHHLQGRLNGVPERHLWITFDTPQSRSLLASAEKRFARFVAPRDYRSVAANTRLAARVLRNEGIEAVVSTGSGLALSFFPLARTLGIDCHYIESAARTDGPSVTGRSIARIPGVEMYTQYPAWSSPRWKFRGTVMDDFVAQEGTHTGPLRVVVTLGTIPYAFDSLVARLRTILPADSDVLWQTGETSADGLPGTAHVTMPHSELVEAMRAADVVISHAGVGSALDALEAGRMPLLVPREQRAGEHIDDHQSQIANLLSERGLAVTARADELSVEHLAAAAGRSVTTAPTTRPFVLR